ELLLLTRLDASDYWHAAAAAAWRRGRGYFAVAVLLLAAGVVAEQLTLGQALVGLSAGVILWCLYFALGFRAFSRGMQANTLGLVLTIGLPLLAGWLYQTAPLLGAAVPPGSIYAAGAMMPLHWLPGPVLGALFTIAVPQIARRRPE